MSKSREEALAEYVGHCQSCENLKELCFDCDRITRVWADGYNEAEFVMHEKCAEHRREARLAYERGRKEACGHGRDVGIWQNNLNKADARVKTLAILLEEVRTRLSWDLETITYEQRDELVSRIDDVLKEVKS